MYDTASNSPSLHCKPRKGPGEKKIATLANVTVMSLYQSMQPSPVNIVQMLFSYPLPIFMLCPIFTHFMSRGCALILACCTVFRMFISCRSGRPSNRFAWCDGCVGFGSTCPFAPRRFRGVVGGRNRVISIRLSCLVGRRGCASLFPCFQLANFPPYIRN